MKQWVVWIALLACTAVGASEPLLAPGRLLIAAPKLDDPNFSATVVLLLDVSANGAMGVVVNRASSWTLGAAVESLCGT